MRKGRVLKITDDLGNLDGFVLKDEVCLLLPYADELFAPLLKKGLIPQDISGKIKGNQRKESSATALKKA